MVTTSSFVYHYPNAQVITPDIGLGEEINQPIIATSDGNISQDNEGSIVNANNWTVVSGNWTIDNATLHGGSLQNTTSLLNRIILDPTPPENITEVSTSFKVNNLDTDRANYASIVYSFINGSNFKLAGINIYGGAIYAVGYTIDNGTQVAEPVWPGVKTDLLWTPGSTYNVTLVNYGTSLGLLINGTEYLNQNINNDLINEGEMGLSYGRIQDITFLDFKTNTLKPQKISNDIQSSTNGDSIITSDTQTVLLDGTTLPENSFIHLYDTTPYQISSGHISAKLPCNDDGSTEISILVGRAPSLSPIELEYVSDLSVLGESCLYTADIHSSESNPITDLALGNNSTDDIDFTDTNSVVISIKEISKI